MLRLERIPSKQSSLPIATQLNAVIRNSVDLLEMASRLRVTPRTVRKVITGQTVSPYVRLKIQTALEKDGILINPSEKSPVQYLLEINRMYQAGGTLRSVGAKIGLSGERVRQLLVAGTEVGLFKYQPPRPLLISREKILSDYKKYLSLGQVAQANKISLPHLQWLRRFHKIERKQLQAIRLAGQRRKCIEMYLSMKEQLGHFPRTTELRKLEKGSYLHGKILKLWGSFGAFQQAEKFTLKPMKSCS